MQRKSLYAYIAALVITSSAMSMELQRPAIRGMELTRPDFQTTHHLEGARLFYKNNRFNVELDGQKRTIQPAFVSKSLRGMSPESIKKTLSLGCYLRLNRLNNSPDYTLNLLGRIRGGGAGGAVAGCFAGKFLVHLIAQGAIIGVCVGANFIVPGSGIPLAIALEKTVGPTIEVISNTVAVGTGILGAVATGPV